MQQFKESDIKPALAAIRDARRKHANPRRADLSERANLLETQQSFEKYFSSFLHKTGFEIDKFEKILAENQKISHRILERQKADAVKQSAVIQNMLRQGIVDRRKTMEYLSTLTPPVPPAITPYYVVVDKPFLIWPTNGISLDDSSIEPWNSWAKITFDTNQQTVQFGDQTFFDLYLEEDLSFYFLWENPSDRYAVINVDGYLVFNGFCKTHAPGGVFAGDREADLSVDARLSLLEWWNQPPTQPLGEADQSQGITSLSAYAGDTFDIHGTTRSEPVFRGRDLRYNLFLIPPQGVAVFELTSAFSYHIGLNGGDVHADFASGDFEIMSPFLQIAILT